MLGALILFSFYPGFRDCVAAPWANVMPPSGLRIPRTSVFAKATPRLVVRLYEFAKFQFIGLNGNFRTY